MIHFSLVEPYHAYYISLILTGCSALRMHGLHRLLMIPVVTTSVELYPQIDLSLFVPKGKESSIMQF